MERRRGEGLDEIPPEREATEDDDDFDDADNDFVHFDFYIPPERVIMIIIMMMVLVVMVLMVVAMLPGRGRCGGGSLAQIQRLEPSQSSQLLPPFIIIITNSMIMIMIIMIIMIMIIMIIIIVIIIHLVHPILEGSNRLLLLLQAGQLVLDRRPLADDHLLDRMMMMVMMRRMMKATMMTTMGIIYPHQSLNRVATLLLVFLEGPEE